jgi:hypothetical protein
LFHLATFLQALSHLQQHWAWLERSNKAALQYPSDFALLSVAPLQLPALRLALQAVSGFRDVHPDRRIRGLLNWQPEGELAAAFSNVAQQQQQQQHPALRTHAEELRMQQEPDFGQQRQQQQQQRSLLADAEQPTQQQPADKQQQQQQQGPPPVPSNSPSADQAVNGDDDADSIWTVSKPPGRLTTKPTIGLDPRNPADREASMGREELRRSSRRRNLLASSWQRLFGSTSGGNGDDDGSIVQQERGQRKLGRSLTAGPDTVTVLLEAGKLWDQGYSGKGIKVRVCSMRMTCILHNTVRYH